jgi:nucleoside-diphosphate-sugar epimerase
MPLYCVTGGAGFIAAHLIRALLGAGHSVRATVRDPEDEGKVGFLWELAGAVAGRLQLVRADLMVEGSFDEAVSGVDGVFHTASPVVVVGHDAKDVQERLVDPIVKGAAGGVHLLLRALLPRRHAQRAALDRRRLLQVVQRTLMEYINDQARSMHACDLCTQLWYAYAKTVAEKEAWRLAKEHGIDLVV